MQRTRWRRRSLKRPARSSSMYWAGRPVHHTLANHWARVVEMIQAGEKMIELVKDPDIISKEIRTIPTAETNGRRGDRRGSSRHADPSLRNRRARADHKVQPDCGHPKQLRADRHERGESRQRPHSWRERFRRIVEYGGDGVSRVRPVQCVRNAYAPGTNAAGHSIARFPGEPCS